MILFLSEDQKFNIEQPALFVITLYQNHSFLLKWQIIKVFRQ
jgi:hypothetical protein